MNYSVHQIMFSRKQKKVLIFRMERFVVLPAELFSRAWKVQNNDPMKKNLKNIETLKIAAIKEVILYVYELE